MDFYDMTVGENYFQFGYTLFDNGVYFQFGCLFAE